MSLYNDPLGLVLKDRMNTRSGIMIKRLVKPTQFTEDLVKCGNEVPQKRRWDLNNNTMVQQDSNHQFSPRQFLSRYGRENNHGIIRPHIHRIMDNMDMDIDMVKI